MNRPRRKDASLECLRGIASFIVLFHHLILAFFPAYSGMFNDASGPNERSSIISFATNGSAAVVFFFVLSGFVLSRGFFLDVNRQRIVAGALKRWPRLFGPVVLSVLFSWTLIKAGAYEHEQVGRMLGSPWLEQFAFAYEPGAGFPSTTFEAALGQGFFTVFFTGTDYFNTNLWTMRFELVASYIVFGLALLVDPATQTKWVGSALILMISLLAFFFSDYYLAFIVGAGLAYWLPAEKRDIPLGVAAFGILISLYLLGYYDDSDGPFTVIHNVLPSVFNQHHVSVLGSVLLIGCVESSSQVRRSLSTSLGSYLGELSFPLYLVHIPIIASVGCRAFLYSSTLKFDLPIAKALAAASVMLVSLGAAHVLMLANRPWLAWIGSLSRWASSKGAANPSLRPIHHSDAQR